MEIEVELDNWICGAGPWEKEWTAEYLSQTDPKVFFRINGGGSLLPAFALRLIAICPSTSYVERRTSMYPLVQRATYQLKRSVGRRSWTVSKARVYKTLEHLVKKSFKT